MPVKTRLIFGCGYLGQRVAQLWRDAGDEVTVVTRRPERAKAFAEHGWRAIVADVRDGDNLLQANLPAFDTVLFAVGYDRTSEATIDEVYAGGMKNVLAALPAVTSQVIYISTTGVYGGAGGDWVDEQTPPDPQREGGKASLAAEQILSASPFSQCGVALRLAGIYGPARIPFLKQLQAGEPIAAAQAGHLNLIHVDDAARVVVAASNSDRQLPPVMCVSDGQPPVRGDYYREVARLIGAAEPTFVDPPADSPRAARAAADKKVRNDLIKQTLAIELLYGDYRSGLAAILGKTSRGG